MQTFVMTALALIAFAANSVLCRLALAGDEIDPASFTMVRLFSGAFTLLFILILQSKSVKAALPYLRDCVRSNGSWYGALALFTYAVTFSYAYITLDTATGALILFGSVQVSMLAKSILTGTRLNKFEWLGMFLACSGLAYLLLPQANTPALLGFILMLLSGISWAAYTIVGQQSGDPLKATTSNFVRSLPFVVVLMSVLMFEMNFTEYGVWLAISSGAITSGVGYAIWYKAIKSLTVIQSGVVQLLVPVIAAIGGIVFASEHVSNELVIASLLTLGGILLVLLSRKLIARNEKAAN